MKKRFDEKNTIILIGALGCNGEVYDGETMKNALFKKYFALSADKVVTVNTTRWTRKPWLPFELIFKLIFNRGGKVVISACDMSAYRLIQFLYYFRVKKNVFYWVVGGGLQNLVGNRINPKYLHYLKRILVQSLDMERSLKALGLENAQYFPNSKDIYQVNKTKKELELIRFVFLSRIIPEKGCDLILNCAERLNNAGKKFKITFYGNVKSYPKFIDRVQNINNVEYRGLLNLRNKKGYEELSENDVFLFPTYYPNEGFPGVLIDAFILGLPIITTDWNFNKEIIESGKTGIIVPPQDEDALFEAMLRFINNPEEIKIMSEFCITEAHKYDSKFLLSERQLRKLELIN